MTIPLFCKYYQHHFLDEKENPKRAKDLATVTQETEEQKIQTHQSPWESTEKSLHFHLLLNPSNRLYVLILRILTVSYKVLIDNVFVCMYTYIYTLYTQHQEKVINITQVLCLSHELIYRIIIIQTSPLYSKSLKDLASICVTP